MNSADVFSLEFDMLTHTSALAGSLDWFRGNDIGAATHRQLLLELNYVINVHSRLREIAADVAPAEDWSSWQEMLSVPALAFGQGTTALGTWAFAGGDFDWTGAGGRPGNIVEIVNGTAVALVGSADSFWTLPDDPRRDPTGRSVPDDLEMLR